MTTTFDHRVHDELEALEAILIEDFIIKQEEGLPNIVETRIYPSTGDKYDQRYVCLTLEVKLTPNYPESKPEIFLRNSRGLDDKCLSTIQAKLTEKLDGHVGNPIVFELVELVRDYLTQCNLPSGQCVICLHDFTSGDVFVKTPCYHHFHSNCLAKHLINSKKYYIEELEKLPNWQRAQVDPYQQTCPVCRNTIEFDETELEQAPPPVESLDAPPFHLTDEIRAMQERMAEILARQVARGGVVGSGDDGPPLLTISTPEDKERELKEAKASKAKNSNSNTNKGARPKAEVNTAPRAVPSTSTDAATEQPYRGPHRGFNRRGKPGRHGRGAR